MDSSVRRRKEELEDEDDYKYEPIVSEKVKLLPEKLKLLSEKEDKKEIKTKKKWSRLSWKQHCLFTVIILTLIFIFFAYYLPNKINAISFSLPPLLSLDGPLTINNKLSSAQKLFEKRLPGPESIAISKDGILYTALHNSQIVKIKDNEIHYIASLGKTNCSSVSQCGRGLGVRLDKEEKYLYVANAYKGLVKVHLISGKIEKVFPLDNEINVNFFDDFDILPNGDIIISEACSPRYAYHESLQCGLEGSALGRVIYYSPKTQKYFLLAEHLAFPNGVTQHTDGESVLVVETTRLRILRIYYKGKDTGKIETFAVLPGLGDNIRPATNGRSGYWVALFSVCTASEMCYLDFLKQMPRIRNFVMKKGPLVYWFRSICSSSLVTRNLIRDYKSVVHLQMIPIPILHLIMVSKHGMVVRVDDNGRIVESLQDTTGHFFTSSEVSQHKDHLYMGSYFLPYLVRYKLDPVN